MDFGTNWHASSNLSFSTNQCRAEKMPTCWLQVPEDTTVVSEGKLQAQNSLESKLPSRSSPLKKGMDLKIDYVQLPVNPSLRPSQEFLTPVVES